MHVWEEERVTRLWEEERRKVIVYGRTGLRINIFMGIIFAKIT